MVTILTQFPTITVESLWLIRQNFLGVCSERLQQQLDVHLGGLLGDVDLLLCCFVVYYMYGKFALTFYPESVGSNGWLQF